MDKFLQRGRILIIFGLVLQFNIGGMDKDDLFVPLMFFIAPDYAL